MKNRIANWLMGYITRKLDPTNLEKYKRLREIGFFVLTTGLFCTLILMLFHLILFIPGVGDASWVNQSYESLRCPIYFYGVTLVGYLYYKWHYFISSMIEQASVAKNAFSDIFENQDFSRVLNDPEFMNMVSNMKEEYTKNIGENDDFLKEIERNIGKF